MADYQAAKYGRRPIWQWIVIYLVIAAVVYGLIYYFVRANRNSNSTSSSNSGSTLQQTPSSGRGY